MDTKKDIKGLNTLRKVSVGRILLILFCWIILTAIVFIILNEEGANAELTDIFSNIVFLGFLLALLIELKRKGIKVYSYVTPNKKNEWRLLFVFIPLIVVSIGFSWLFDFMLYKIAPDFLQNRNLWIENNPMFNPEGSFWHISATFISICIVAPFAEEFLFRGIIFDKIRTRWSILAGTVISSFIFGLLHFDVLGAIVFGVVLCILYLETKSLFVPIGIHFLNNLSALLLGPIWSEDWVPSPEMNYLFEYLWLDISFLVIGSIWLGWFIYTHFHLLKAPHFRKE